MRTTKYYMWILLSLSLAVESSAKVIDINQDLHFRNIEYHSDTQNSTDYDDYIESNLTTGNGDDTIIVDDDIGGKLDAEHGGARRINTGNGDDTIIVADDIQYGAKIDTGNGDDTIKIGGDLDDGASIIMGTGDDILVISKTISDTTSINTGIGDDKVDINKIKDSSLITGIGDDIINIQRIDKGSTKIDSGIGDDILYLKNISGDYDNGSVNLGLGDDILTIDDTLSGTKSIFNGGIGFDSLILTSVSKEKWNNEIKEIFTNFEKVTFKDGSTIKLDSNNNEIFEDGDQNLHFRNIEYHSDTENSTNYDDYIDSNLTTGSGDDTIIIDDDIGGKRDINHGGDRRISTNDGDDTIIVVDDIQYGAKIDTGNGDDTIKIGGDLENGASITMGDGNDTIDINTIKDSFLTTGSGDDIINIKRVDKGSATIDSGSDNDTIYLKNVSSGFDNGSVTLGDGDDTLKIDDTLSGTKSIFDGGDGLDSLILKNVSKKKWDAGIKDIFINFENITLKNGVTITLASIPKSQTIDILSPSANEIILYKTITLELDAPNSKTIKVINQTMVSEHNKTVVIKGIKSNELFYFYNIPLQQGDNNIVITAIDEKNISIKENLQIYSDANGTAPIAIRASKYSGVNELNTTIETRTLLDAIEYLLDSDGDGVIDQTNEDGNFTINLTKEGRYRPRVTIRTENNLLYSTGNYAMSLDVKSSEDQKDPINAQPIDVAKEFVEALISDDRESVERLVGNNQKLIRILYGHPKATEILKNIYRNITKWEQTYHPMGDASVKILFDAEGKSYGGGFEMNVISSQLNNGRIWTIGFIY